MSLSKLFPHAVTALTALSLSVAMLSTAHAASFYKWIDHNGSTHYTQQHPGKNAAKIIKTVLVDDTPPPSSGNNNTQANDAQNDQPAHQQQTTLDSPQTNNVAPQPQQAPSVVVTPVKAESQLIKPSQEQSRPTFSSQ